MSAAEGVLSYEEMLRQIHVFAAQEDKLYMTSACVELRLPEGHEQCISAQYDPLCGILEDLYVKAVYVDKLCAGWLLIEGQERENQHYMAHFKYVVKPDIFNHSIKDIIAFARDVINAWCRQEDGTMRPVPKPYKIKVAPK